MILIRDTHPSGNRCSFLDVCLEQQIRVWGSMKSRVSERNLRGKKNTLCGNRHLFIDDLVDRIE